MSTNIKLYVGRKVLDCLLKSTKIVATTSQLKSLIQVGSFNQETNNVEMNMPLGILEHQFGISNVSEILKIQPDDIIQNIECIKDRANRKICFHINKNVFIKEIVEQCIIPEINSDSKKIVVEYSSPNVAKPFHVGHLRSTILGNFIANLNKFSKNNVVKLNYLGDWGTQFGFIKVGVDELKYTKDDIKTNALQILYQSYVHANKLAETDATILERAKQEFSKLENGLQDEIDNWKMYIGYTIEELQLMYKRLGVVFDEYNYESMYSAKQIKTIIEALNAKKVLQTLPDGKQVANINNRNVSVIKSDGSTLYLTRDIAAAVDRYSRYEFDRMYYVVDNGQNDHFNALQGILHQMDYPWAHRIKHVKFGRIKGMSTRKGNAIFLKDILDETRDLMIQRQIESPTTKVPITDTRTSDILGVSCVIINDLKQRRQKDYEFDWDKVLQVKGDSGIKLQYVHCRLCSLEKNCGVVPATDCMPEVLVEPEVIALVRELARFNDVLFKAEDQLEACHLVTYLFQLCNHINKALKVLRVKDEDPVLASQRLLLFNNSREVLKQGMMILGLQPLTEM